MATTNAVAPRLPYVVAKYQMSKFKVIEDFDLETEELENAENVIGAMEKGLPELTKVVGPYLCGDGAGDAIIISNDNVLQRKLAYILPLVKSLTINRRLGEEASEEIGPQVLVVYPNITAVYDAENILSRILPQKAKIGCYTQQNEGDWSRISSHHIIIIDAATLIGMCILHTHNYTEKLFVRLKFFAVDGLDSLDNTLFEQIRTTLFFARQNYEMEKPRKLVLCAASWTNSVDTIIQDWPRESHALPTIFINEYHELLKFARVNWKLHQDIQGAAPAQVEDRQLFDLIMGRFRHPGSIMVCCNNFKSAILSGTMRLLKENGIRFDKLTKYKHWAKKAAGPNRWIYFCKNIRLKKVEQSHLEKLGVVITTLYSVGTAPTENCLDNLKCIWNSFPRFNEGANAVVHRDLEVNFFVSGDEPNFTRLYQLTKLLRKNNSDVQLELRGGQLITQMELLSLEEELRAPLESREPQPGTSNSALAKVSQKKQKRTYYVDEATAFDGCDDIGSGSPLPFKGFRGGRNYDRWF